MKGVLINDTKCLLQRLRHEAGLVSMPLAIGSFPENTPDYLSADILDLGNGFLDVFIGTPERGAHNEQRNGLIRTYLKIA